MYESWRGGIHEYVEEYTPASRRLLWKSLVSRAVKQNFIRAFALPSENLVQGCTGTARIPCVSLLTESTKIYSVFICLRSPFDLVFTLFSTGPQVQCWGGSDHRLQNTEYSLPPHQEPQRWGKTKGAHSVISTAVTVIICADISHCCPHNISEGSHLSTSWYSLWLQSAHPIRLLPGSTTTH